MVYVCRCTSTSISRGALNPATWHHRALSAVTASKECRRARCSCGDASQCRILTSAKTTLPSPRQPMHRQQQSRCVSSSSSGGSSSSKHKGAAASTSNLLSTAVLRRIKADLLEADAAGDNTRRIDHSELKAILRKYSNVFSDEDVEAIGDLFYVGSGGKPISHMNFLKAVQQAHSLASESIGDGEGEGLRNRNRSNPLGFQSLDDMGCWASRGEGASAYFDTQGEFDRHLLKYIREMLRKVDG